MTTSRTVVVTGSTRGLGFGLASAFLARGCNVVVNGRSADALAAAAQKLGSPERVLTVQAEIHDEAAIRALWAKAIERFGRVDVWINNAGSGSAQVPFAAQSAGQVGDVVRTNVLGMVLATHVAIE